MNALHRLLFAIAFLLASRPCALTPAAFALETEPQAVVSTIVVPDYFPYSFTGELGEPAGFAVELARAAGKAVGLSVDVRLGQWGDARQALETGRIDFLPMMAYSAERDEIFDFSPPHTIAYDAIFVRTGTENLSKLYDLSGKKVILLERDLASDYLNNEGRHLKVTPVYAKSLAEGLRLLNDGVGDAALMPKLVALSHIRSGNLKYLDQSPEVVTEYSRHFCFTVRHGNLPLLEKLTQGLAVVKTNGEYKRLYDKWFSTLEKKDHTVLYLLIALGASLLALAVLLAFHAKKALHFRKALEAGERKLKERDTQLSNLFLHTGHAIAVSLNGVILEVNSAFVSLFGYDREKELVGSQGYLLIIPDERERILGYVEKRTLAEECPTRYETVGLRKDGSVFLMEVEIRTFVRNGLVHTHSTVKDLTDAKRLEEEVAKNEERLKLLLDQAPDAILVYDAELGHFVSANRPAQELFGRTKKEILSMGPLELSGPDPGPEVVRSITVNTDKALRGDPTLTSQLVTRPDGTKILCEVRVMKLPFTDRSLLRVSYLDVTEAYEAKKVLKEALLHNRSIVENSPVGILTYRASGECLSANRAAEALVGTDVSALVGQNFHYIPSWKISGLYRLAVETLALKETKSAEIHHLSTFGREFWCNAVCTSYRTSGEDRLLLILNETTSLKIAEDQRIDSERNLKLAQQMAKLGHWKFLPATGKLEASEELYRIAGVDASSQKPWRFLKCLPREDRRRFLIAAAASLQGDTGEECTLSLVSPDGTEKEVRVRLEQMADREQKLHWLIGIVQDVSEEAAAQREHLRLETHLRQAQKLESIGTLAGGIAHDFNNILGAILGYTELMLERSTSSKEDREDLEEIYSAGSRARDLVKQILLFSRKEAELREPVPFHKVVGEAMRLLRQTIPTTIAFSLDVDSKSGNVLADPTQLHQVVMNLCTNSYHAMKDGGGLLHVSLKRATTSDHDFPELGEDDGREWLLLKVIDTGRGMNPHTLSRIFDPFFTTKEKGEGTGLGLAVVHSIVKAHNGHIKAESVLGTGTSFSVLFPLFAKNAETLQKESDLFRGRGEHILLVDDEPQLVKMQAKVLEKLGYKVTGLTSSVEALNLLKSEPYRFDLLLTDQTMPVLTGAMLALEAFEIRPALPVIICTGYSEALDELRAREMGIEALLMKPLAREKLAKAVRQALAY